MREHTRTRDYLLEQGYAVDTVERWITFPDQKAAKCPVCQRGKEIRTRQDCFGCIDLIAAKADVPGVLFVQTTDYSNQSKRVKKTQFADATKILLKAGNRVEIHAWRQVPDKPGGRWKLRVVGLYLDDFGDVAARVLLDEAQAEQTTIKDETEKAPLFANVDDF